MTCQYCNDPSGKPIQNKVDLVWSLVSQICGHCKLNQILKCSNRFKAIMETSYRHFNQQTKYQFWFGCLTVLILQEKAQMWCTNSHPYNTRHDDIYNLPEYHLTICERKPIYAGIYNHLPRNLQIVKGKLLKRRLTE